MPTVIMSAAVGGLLVVPAFGRGQTLAGSPHDPGIYSAHALEPLNFAQSSLKDVGAVQKIGNAASDFENIARLAINGKSDSIPENLRIIVTAVYSLKTVLPVQTYQDLVDRLSDISDAKKNRDLEGVALAAAEGFRTMVLAQKPANLSAPIKLYMLEYTGLKALALTRTDSPDWQRLSAARDEAKEYWTEISPGIKRKAVTNLMNRIIVGIDRAIAQQDVPALKFAIKLQIDAVQLLKG
jgi:hypothetical protein